MKHLLISLLFPLSTFSGTFLSNSGAFFAENEVRVTVASNTDCSNAGVTKSELIQMITPAVDDYWNTVTTSRLKLVNGGEYETTDNNFNTARLCNADTDTSCPDDATIIQRVPHIVISCNSNSTDNFDSSKGQDASVYAITLANNTDGNNLKGAVIIINNTPANPFNSASYAQKLAIIAHEIGHAVGIGHTPQAKNIMYYTPTPERFALGPDDAMALTFLYPKKFDGCGILSTKNVDDDFFGTFLFSLLFFLGFGVAFKKIFLKLRVSIFQNRLSRSLR